MIIIFEGHDMTGKTNIANELSKKLHLSVVKSKREKNRWWDPQIDLMYAVDAQVELFEQLKLSAIYDRFHASEYAYSKAFKRFTSYEKIFEIDERLSKLNTIIIYCYKDEKYYQDDDAYITPIQKYNNIKQYYDEFLSLTKCKYLKLNTNDENLQSQILKILEFIGDKQ